MVMLVVVVEGGGGGAGGGCLFKPFNGPEGLFVYSLDVAQ